MNWTPFELDSQPPVRGFVHRPHDLSGDGLVLTHGAGSNCEAPLLVAVATAFAEAGFAVLRCNLPFRQVRRHGPPRPGEAAESRKGLRNAVDALRTRGPGGPFKRIFLGGHSYGGRQATILAAEDEELATRIGGLLLLSYPLHPPGKPAQLRTAHFPTLRKPALFVHGSRDAFGSLDEMEAALKLVPARTSLLPVEGAGHELGFGRPTRRAKAVNPDVLGRLVVAFQELARDRGPGETE